MTNNPILDEIHNIRRKLLKDAGGTLDGLVDQLQAEEAEIDRTRFLRTQTSQNSPQEDCAINNPTWVQKK